MKIERGETIRFEDGHVVRVEATAGGIETSGITVERMQRLTAGEAKVLGPALLSELQKSRQLAEGATV